MAVEVRVDVTKEVGLGAVMAGGGRILPLEGDWRSLEAETEADGATGEKDGSD